MADYLPLLFMLVMGGIFAAGSLATARFFAPRQATSAKEAAYECGIVPEAEPADRFPVRFYLVAMIFIIVDIEIVFLYPWAVIYGRLGLFGLVEMLLFAAAVFVSFVYLIANGALDWGPTSRLRRLQQEGHIGRTTESTIRRVGRSPAGDEVAA